MTDALTDQTPPPLIDQIREILVRDHVSFAELSRLPGFRGDWSIGVPDSNVIFWTGMSEEACAAIETIRQEGVYELAPTVLLTYLVDGTTLNLPLVKSRRKYKTPRWAPCVFRRKA